MTVATWTAREMEGTLAARFQAKNLVDDYKGLRRSQRAQAQDRSAESES